MMPQSADAGAFPLLMYWFVVVGIVISVVLPILRGLLPKTREMAGEVPAWKRYLAVGAFSLLTAIVVLAFAKDQPDKWKWYDAVLAGFAWDSVLQKAVNG